MDDPPNVSMQKPGPADDLARTRDHVLDVVAGSTEFGGSIQAPTLRASAPLRPVPAELEAKIANRAAAGLAPLSTTYPRGRAWQRVVLPSGSLAALDAVGAVLAAVDGRSVLAIVAAVLFVPFAGIAGSAARFASRDPLRLTAGDLRELNDASTWTSHQLWLGPLSSCAERALLIIAMQAADRIAKSTEWRSGRLDEHRVRMNLVTELDEIDAQTFRIATARHQTPPTTSPVADDAWETTVTRVAALTCYADELDALALRESTAASAAGDPARDSALMAGSVQDELAAGELTALTYFLTNALRDGERNPRA